MNKNKEFFYKYTKWTEVGVGARAEVKAYIIIYKPKDEVYIFNKLFSELVGAETNLTNYKPP